MQPLPSWSPLRIVDDRRDRTVFAVRHPSEDGDFHFVVEWDEDRDPRVLGAALALYYRHPELFESVLIWSEHKAQLTVLARPGTVIHVPHGGNKGAVVPILEALEGVLSGIVTGYAIDGDAWEVEARLLTKQDLAEGSALFGIDRLYKLGPVSK